MTRRRSTRWYVLALLVAAALGAGALLFLTPDRLVDVGGGATTPTIGAVYFGGPDKPAGALRDVLLARVRATPPGQSIDWATYYFLDDELAQALIDASRRGVRVRLVIEGAPRSGRANATVLTMLRRAHLTNVVTVREEPPAPLDLISGKLHAKIYAFSWPRPVALIGSFNPSGGDDDDNADAREIRREIGDQDRGHNLLVEITSPGLVRVLVGHVARLAANGGSMSRFRRDEQSVYRDRDTQLYFYPRLHSDVVETAIDQLGPGDRLWAAISHLKGDAVGTLEDAAERGVAIHLVVHDTERRVPQDVVDRLLRDGIDIHRYSRPDALPMHDKFFIMEKGDRYMTYFGSLNFNRNSRFLNDEVLARSTNPALARALIARFAEIEQEIRLLKKQDPGR